jgi:hypothetical protein
MLVVKEHVDEHKSAALAFEVYSACQLTLVAFCCLNLKSIDASGHLRIFQGYFLKFNF